MISTRRGSKQREPRHISWQNLPLCLTSDRSVALAAGSGNTNPKCRKSKKQHHHCPSDTPRNWLAEVEDQRKRKQAKYLFFCQLILISWGGHHSSCSRLSPIHSQLCATLTELLTASGLYLPLKMFAFDLCPYTSYISEPLKTLSVVLMAIGIFLRTQRSRTDVLKTVWHSKSAPEPCTALPPEPSIPRRISFPLYSALGKALTWSCVLVTDSMIFETVERIKANTSCCWGFCTMGLKYFIAVIKNQVI